jgi:hypothetical protein
MRRSTGRSGIILEILRNLNSGIGHHLDEDLADNRTSGFCSRVPHSQSKCVSKSMPRFFGDVRILGNRWVISGEVLEGKLGEASD